MSKKLIAGMLVVGVLAVVGHALATTSTPSPTSTTSTAPQTSSTAVMTHGSSTAALPNTTTRTDSMGMMPVLDAEQCMLAATMERESAVGDAFDRFSNAERAALTTRQMSLESAISNSTRHTIADAIDNAWNSYRRERKNVVKTYREAVKTIWSQYENEIKICKKMGPLKATDKGNSDDEKLED